MLHEVGYIDRTDVYSVYYRIYTCMAFGDIHFKSLSVEFSAHLTNAGRGYDGSLDGYKVEDTGA